MVFKGGQSSRTQRYQSSLWILTLEQIFLPWDQDLIWHFTLHRRNDLSEDENRGFRKHLRWQRDLGIERMACSGKGNTIGSVTSEHPSEPLMDIRKGFLWTSEFVEITTKAQEANWRHWMIVFLTAKKSIDSISCASLKITSTDFCKRRSTSLA